MKFLTTALILAIIKIGNGEEGETTATRASANTNSATTEIGNGKEGASTNSGINHIGKGNEGETTTVEASVKQLQLINSQEDLDSIINGARDKLAVIDFSANWCAPCVQLKENHLEKWAAEPGNTNVDFYEVEVDVGQWQQHFLVQKYNVLAYPTIFFVKDGEVKYRIVGASDKKVNEMRDRIDELKGGTSG